jgi:hypothetical protein
LGFKPSFKQIAGILVLLAAAVVVLLIARPWEAPKEPFADWTWREYSPPDRDFQVALPEGEVLDSNRFLQGIKLKNYGLSRDNKHIFIIMFGEVPPHQQRGSATEIAAAWRDRLLKMVNSHWLAAGRVKSEGDATLDGHPCREVVIGVVDKLTVSNFILRVCRRGTMLYIVMVGGEDFNLEAAPVRRYFASFKFLKEPPTPKPSVPLNAPIRAPVTEWARRRSFPRGENPDKFTHREKELVGENSKGAKAVQQWHTVLTAQGEGHDLALVRTLLMQFDPVWKDNRFQPELAERYLARLRGLTPEVLGDWQIAIGKTTMDPAPRLAVALTLIPEEQLFAGATFAEAAAARLRARLPLIPVDAIGAWATLAGVSRMEAAVTLMQFEPLFVGGSFQEPTFQDALKLLQELSG